MQRTIGIDFGTHQTKICIEEKDRHETNYRFVQFEDNHGGYHYTLPSLVRIDAKGKLHYGFQTSTEGRLIRYFKQATFCTGLINWKHPFNADFIGVWYLANLLFDFDHEYGDAFAVQMGAPTDSEHLEQQQEKATALLLEAFRLVIEEFDHDKDAFLACNIKELLIRTKEPHYDKKQKEWYNIFILPEAYACLRPLTKAKKIRQGLNLMVDVGGGTTDVSFFNINQDTGEPRLYHFFSVPKALNYLCKIDNAEQAVEGENEGHARGVISKERLEDYKTDLGSSIFDLHQNVVNLFRLKTKRGKEIINRNLQNRPLVYVGGGSKYEDVVTAYGGFNECRIIDTGDWDEKHIEDIDEIRDLCPLLSTAYGLCMATKNDTIEYTPLSGIFDGENFKGAEDDENEILSISKNYVYKDTQAYIRDQNRREEEASRQRLLVSGEGRNQSVTVSSSELYSSFWESIGLIGAKRKPKTKVRPKAQPQVSKTSINPLRNKIFDYIHHYKRDSEQNKGMKVIIYGEDTRMKNTVRERYEDFLLFLKAKKYYEEDVTDKERMFWINNTKTVYLDNVIDAIEVHHEYYSSNSKLTKDKNNY